MANTGSIVNLVTKRSGSVTVQAYAAGSINMELDSVVDFHDVGGFVLINGAAFAYSGRSTALGTITMSNPLAADLDKGTEILIFPAALEKWALVRPDGVYPEDAVLCRVPHALAGLLAADGQRNLDRQEKIEYTIAGQQRVITNVLSKQPALTEDSVPDGLIKETMISPEAITTPLLAANSVAAIHMQSSSVDTDALTADAIDGMTVTGALLRTAAAGARMEITTEGLLQYDAVGGVLTRIGGEHNKFSGSVDADDMIVRDGLELFGRNNYFGPNSQVTLRTGQGGSNSPPTVTHGYKTQAISSAYTQGFRPLSGYLNDGVNEWGVAEFFDESRLYASGNRYYDLHQIRSTASDGVTTSWRWKPHGYVRIKNASGERAVLWTEFKNAGYAVGSYPQMGIFALDDAPLNTSGTGVPLEKNGLVVHNFSWARSTVIGRVIINAAHSTMVAYASLDNPGSFDTLELKVFEFTADGAAITSPHDPPDVNFAPWRVHVNEKLIGVTFGLAHQLHVYEPADGADQRVWVINTTHQNIVIHDDSGVFVRRPEWEWPIIPGSNKRVFAHGNTASNTFTYFAHLTSGDNYNGPKQLLQKYSNWGWSQNTPNKWFSFAWRGHSSKSPEWLTPPSPKTVVAPVKHSTMTISIPALPTPEAGQNQPRDPDKDVYGWVLYHGSGSSEPINTAMYRMSSSPTGDPVATQTLEIETFPVASGSNPLSATQGFPNLSPASIISSAVDGSSNPLLLLDGDGNIKGKSLTVADPWITVKGVAQGISQDYAISTVGASIDAGYKARYARTGNWIQAQFFGGVNTTLSSDYIGVSLPAAPAYPPSAAVGSALALDAAIGVGVIHNPGLYRVSCIIHMYLVGGTWYAVWQPSNQSNLFVTTATNINGFTMSGDETLSFTIAYEATPL